MKKVVISGMLGNGLEWYDYALYGHMAFILSKLFFPGENETAKLLATFGVFAVGFVFRPLGAILFGWMGDRYGRRVSLVVAILMMAIPTGAIGILPTYEQIGIAAPILLTLIRVFQGLSLGGEFSGSITYIVEHAPPDKRGYAGSASVVSLICGFLLGSFVSMGTAWLMPDTFEIWGWRIPFLLGILIGLVGFYIRTHCEESPLYEQAKRDGTISTTPVRCALTKHWRDMLKTFGMYMAVTMPFYLLSIYLITYTEKELGLPYKQALVINVVAMMCMLGTVIIGAMLSDRIGRKRVMVPAVIAMALLIVPIFLVMDMGGFWPVLLAQAAFGLVLGVYIAPVPTVLVESFPTSVRYTGMAIAYNAAAAIFGGTAPMACAWLIASTGSRLSIAFYVVICCIFALIALAKYQDRWKEELQ